MLVIFVGLGKKNHFTSSAAELIWISKAGSSPTFCPVVTIIKTRDVLAAAQMMPLCPASLINWGVTIGIYCNSLCEHTNTKSTQLSNRFYIHTRWLMVQQPSIFIPNIFIIGENKIYVDILLSLTLCINKLCFELKYFFDFL